MKYDPVIHHRRSIRLQAYDYSQAGAYFITICTQNRYCLFGEIKAAEMQLTDAGKMIYRWYMELGNKFPDIECDAFICMPNHVHFVVVNVGADLCVRPDPNSTDLCVRPDPNSTDLCVRPDGGLVYHTRGQTHRSAPTGEHIILGQHVILGEHIGSPLHRVVQWFKTMSTNEYIRGVKQRGWAPFPGKLWQRNYWEHIIRNESELNQIREYIGNNPAKWESDKLFILPSLYGQPVERSNEIREPFTEYATEAWFV